MYSDTYYVDRESGTYSDTCAAFGLAYILERVLTDAGEASKVTIQDAGTCYIVKLGTPLSSEILQSATYPDELLPLLQEEKHPEGARHYPFNEYFNILKSRSKEVAEEADVESVPMEVPPDLGVYQIIRLQQGDGLMNTTARALWRNARSPDAYAQLLRVLLGVYSTTPNALDQGKKHFTKWKKSFVIDDQAPIEVESTANEAEDVNPEAEEETGEDEVDAATSKTNAKGNSFSPEATLLAIYNPSQQKSINRAKADGAKNENNKGFWIPEWLKMVGMPKCALAVSVKGGKKKEPYNKEDKKVYALSPSFLSLSSHSQIMGAFQNSVYGSSSIKADVAVLLFYTRQFLGYVARGGRPPRFGSIRNVVDGFSCAYFKKSGSQSSAYSLTALSYIQLPAWVALSESSQPAEIQNWLDLIEEQEKVIFFRFPVAGGFDDFVDENKGEGLELLRLYREWLSGGRLESLLEFHADFASLVMSQAAQKKAYRQFSVSGLNRLFSLMNTPTTPTLQEIISDAGFIEVARAIRLSTVTAQRLKAKGIKPGHEIRYGLAQELKTQSALQNRVCRGSDGVR